ncbi:hypothetical protein MKX01_037214 [Papaver californicum]|nr:hypothetical protein MKX01_037214 [Papaver californicum]
MLTTDSGSTATPYDYVAREVNPSGALQPGLVYETNPDDSLLFLCNYGYKSKNVTRTLTNVGPENETNYAVTVYSPREMEVKVVPSKLQFSKSSNKQSYQAIFSPSSSVTHDLFGSIMWSNGKYKVRTAFVIATSS